MAIEGAQTGDLARKRGRAHGRPLIRSGGEPGEELGDVTVAGGGGLQAPAIEEAPELEQVRAVGLERVPRQSPLQLQIGEKVEDQWADAGRCERQGARSAHALSFAHPPGAPSLCNQAFSRRASQYSPMSVLASRHSAIAESSSA